MTKGAILVAAVLMAVLVTAAPALAQEDQGRSGSSGALAHLASGEPPQPPRDYAFRNGEVYVSGDLVIGCREFVQRFDEGYHEYGDQAQAERVLEQCKEAGLPAREIPPEVRQEMRQDFQYGELPETGGGSPILLLTGLILSGAGLIVYRNVERRG